jgi:glutamate decarboxylase
LNENLFFFYRNFSIEGHPRFINQLSQGVDMISLVGEIITSSVNANMFTYEVAPVFNLMEESVLAHMRQCCGWPTDELTSKNGDGVLAPGGAVSNLYAVLAARHYAFPDIKKHGIRDGLRPAMIISKHVRIL